jgi:hypothetical protein
VKTGLKIGFKGSHPCENWLGEPESEFKKKKKEQYEFSHENPNLVLWGLGGKMWRLELGLGFKVLRFKAAPPPGETTKERRGIQKLRGFFFLVNVWFFVFFCIVFLVFFRVFNLASLLVLCCCYLWWCVISHLALLLFVLVHCPLTLHCGYLLWSFILHCCYLLWSLTLHCDYLLWSFTLHCYCLLWSLALWCCWLLCLSPCITIAWCGSSPSPCFTVQHLFQIFTSPYVVATCWCDVLSSL